MTTLVHLKAHNKDLGGGFIVRRLLPNALRQAVGPFIFFDHFGPVSIKPEDNHDVRPHPHIGLATISYLFDGVIQHKDNLGYTQNIEPGAINLMIAGKGIVHSERRPPAMREKNYTNHGLQLWIALPTGQEKIAAAFHHVPAVHIPHIDIGPISIRVLMGQAFEKKSPVPTLSPTLYLDIQIAANSTWELPMLADEQAIYPIEGELSNVDAVMEANTLQLQSAPLVLSSGNLPARFVVIGGQALGHRFIWWNFVASHQSDIDAAAQAWEIEEPDSGMHQVPGEVERIPMPARRRPEA
ncbi:pirin family protein [Undibacterium fentianense]|uniref:Pirin family protein n=1 Tax=Undibacterium fentianense TaxID=2828728 RepID=A0A941E2T2_9BURK|nr:pirin family protein [Undibacterium fentianense]MBR7801310.1 pirin family protein [Undibacterium fentianense]